MQLIPIPPDAAPAIVPPDAEHLSDLLQATHELYRRQSPIAPWLGYLAWYAEPDGSPSLGEYRGSCAFKSNPVGGRVEIAYFTFPEFEGQGVATAMATGLVEIARAADPTLEVFAQTLPEHGASTAILTRLGFEHVADVVHAEDGRVWEWVRR